MNRPSGVRAVETTTTGSEAVAMAVLLNVRVSLLHYIHHMMRCGICNGGEGINSPGGDIFLPFSLWEKVPSRSEGG
jgi:hypothetical protein